jgi:hypothetical protein
MMKANGEDETPGKMLVQARTAQVEGIGPTVCGFGGRRRSRYPRLEAECGETCLGRFRKRGVRNGLCQTGE